MRRQLRFFSRMSRGLLLVGLLGCGETRRNSDEGGGGGSSGSTSAGVAASTSAGAAAPSQNGGQGHGPGGTAAAGGDRAVDRVDIGRCRFEDPNVELLARYQILQADEADGAIDGSAGPEDVKRLDVTQAVGALGGLECLENLEELWLSVYERDAPPVSLSFLSGLSRLRKLSLAGPFVLEGFFGGLALEDLRLRSVALDDLEEVSKEAGIRELSLTDLPLTSLNGVAGLPKLVTFRIEKAPIASLTGLERISSLEELSLTDLPRLTNLAGISPHTGLRSVLLSQVPVTSLLPLAGARGLTSINVWTSALTDLLGLEDKPALSNVTVTNAGLTELGPLSGLSRLSYLDVSGNAITDLSPLAGCPLTYLSVSSNAITSLAPLSGMTSLHGFLANANSLSAIDTDLPASLESLSLAENSIRSLEPLAAHPVQHLNISGNPLESLQPLFDLPGIISLDADDVGHSALQDFPLARLRRLSAQNNGITSAEPLAGLGDISVDLSGNAVTELPSDFVGPAARCGGLVLLDNPLDLAAQARLSWLCANTNASYLWTGGACDKCPRI